jgi:hypothetical protein
LQGVVEVVQTLVEAVERVDIELPQGLAAVGLLLRAY